MCRKNSLKTFSCLKFVKFFFENIDFYCQILLKDNQVSWIKVNKRSSSINKSVNIDVSLRNIRINKKAYSEKSVLMFLRMFLMLKLNE